eukprot:scpid22290/ scgid0529/ 
MLGLTICGHYLGVHVRVVVQYLELKYVPLSMTAIDSPPVVLIIIQSHVRTCTGAKKQSHTCTFTCTWQTDILFFVSFPTVTDLTKRMASSLLINSGGLLVTLAVLLGAAMISSAKSITADDGSPSTAISMPSSSSPASLLTCDTLNRQLRDSRDLRDLPFGMKVRQWQVAHDAEDDSCECNELLREARLDYYTDNTAQKELNEMQGARSNIGGCEWTMECRYSPSRFPHFYHVAKAANMDGEANLCGSRQAGDRCEKVESHEMVLRRVQGSATHAKGALNGEDWEISLEKRSIAYVCRSQTH